MWFDGQHRRQKEMTMKTMKTIQKTFGIMACIGILAASATSVLAQTSSLASLASGGTLTIDHKIFSGFSYQASGLTTFDPNQIFVTATQSGGIDYLTWTGNMSLSSGGFASADLLLNYIVTVTPGGTPIDWIDQSYGGTATNALLAIDETAATGSFGGTVVGNSHLEIGDFSDPPAEPVQGDNLIINPSQSVLYVTKDIGFGVLGGGFATINQVEQSFHQVPEPSAMLLGSLGGVLLIITSMRLAKRD
jgi:hypothetical protein